MENISQDKFEGYQRIAYRRAEPISKLHSSMIVLETTGGNCPECGKPWQKIVVDNNYAKFVYYDPTCNCWGRCPDCRVSWHREVTAGSPISQITKCNSCGWVKYPTYGRLCTACGEGFQTEFKDTYWSKCPDCISKDGRKKKEKVSQY